MAISGVAGVRSCWPSSCISARACRSMPPRCDDGSSVWGSDIGVRDRRCAFATRTRHSTCRPLLTPWPIVAPTVRRSMPTRPTSTSTRESALPGWPGEGEQDSYSGPEPQALPGRRIECAHRQGGVGGGRAQGLVAVHRPAVPAQAPLPSGAARRARRGQRHRAQELHHQAVVGEQPQVRVALSTFAPMAAPPNASPTIR